MDSPEVRDLEALENLLRSLLRKCPPGDLLQPVRNFVGKPFDSSLPLVLYLS